MDTQDVRRFIDILLALKGEDSFLPAAALLQPLRIKPTQRCHACWKLPDEKKKLADRQHECPHCGETCGRDENAAKVLLRWLEEKLSGREPSEVWSGVRLPETGASAMKHETHAIA